MKVQEIEAFLAVCQYGSFTKAAEKCYTTQPNISWQIASLEKKLGHQLIVRGKGMHQFKLTRSGELFLPQAEKWLKLWRETEQILNTEGEENYSFSCVPSVSNMILTGVFLAFQDKVPECALTQSTNRSLDICNSVEYGRLNCGLVCDAYFGREMLVEPIAEEKMVFVCRRDGGYRGIQKIKELDVSQQIYVRFFDEENTWQKQYLGIDHKKTKINTTAIQEPAPLFTSKEAWAIVPYSYLMAKFPGDRFETLPLDMMPPTRKFLLVSQKPPEEPYYQIIKDELRRIFDEAPGFTLIS